MMIAPYFLIVAAQLVGPAAAPQLNVEPSCHASSGLDLADGQSFGTCMRDENEARDELAKNWSSYSGSARSRCAAEVKIGGDPSYVELLECLEMDKIASPTSSTSTTDRQSSPEHSSAIQSPESVTRSARRCAAKRRNTKGSL